MLPSEGPARRPSTTDRKTKADWFWWVFWKVVGVGIVGLIVWTSVECALSHTPTTATTSSTTRQSFTTTTNPAGMTSEEVFAAKVGFVFIFSDVQWAANYLPEWLRWTANAQAEVATDREEYWSHMEYFLMEYDEWLENLSKSIEDSVYQASVVFPEALAALTRIQAAESDLRVVQGMLYVLRESQADSSEIQWNLENAAEKIRGIQDSMLAAVEEVNAKTPLDK